MTRGIGLRPYQIEAIAAWRAMLDGGKRRTVINLPTGTGKTITGLALARDYGKRTLWIAHRQELLTQPLKTLPVIWPGADGGIVKAERNNCDARDIVFASIQTIQSERRLQQLGEFGLVVTDECHHVLAKSWEKTIESVGCMRADGPPLLGLTATVERTDQRAMGSIFDAIAYQMPLNKAIEAGYLVPVVPIKRPIAVDLDAVAYRAGDWATGELDTALVEAGIVTEVANAIEEHGNGRKIVVFTISVSQAHAVADELVRRGHAAEALDGTMRDSERADKLARLASGETRIISNCMVLTEGFDEPSIDCIVMARPTSSKTLYLQSVGRGLRLYPNKQDCFIIDMVGASKRHTLMQAPTLIGLYGAVESEKTDKKERDEEDQAAISNYLDRLKKQIKGLGTDRGRLRWVEPAPGNLVLSIGTHGPVVMTSGPGGWTVCTPRESLCDSSVSLELALGIAEDYARRVRAMDLISLDSPWRRRPPTDKQIAALKRSGIAAVPQTSGEASDLLAAHFARAEVEAASSKQLYALRKAGVLGWHQSATKAEASRLFARMRVK